VAPTASGSVPRALASRPGVVSVPQASWSSFPGISSHALRFVDMDVKVTSFFASNPA
jgi:hypothetical protein